MVKDQLIVIIEVKFHTLNIARLHCTIKLKKSLGEPRPVFNSIKRPIIRSPSRLGLLRRRHDLIVNVLGSMRISEALVPHCLDTMRCLKVYRCGARRIVHHHYWLFHWHECIGQRCELLVVLQARDGRIVHCGIATHPFVQAGQKVVAVSVLGLGDGRVLD